MKNNQTVELDGLKKSFAHELEMLDAAKPKKISFADIGVKIGSPWMPKHVLACFLRDYVVQSSEYPNGYSATRFRENFMSPDGKIDSDSIFVDTPLGRQLTLRFQQCFHDCRYRDYAIRRDGIRILNWDGIIPIINELLLGQRKTITRTVRISDDKSKSEVDEVATASLRAKENKLEKAVHDYLASDNELIMEVEKAYNEKMNRRVDKTYNGEMIEVDGLAKQYKLRDYQKNAVMRIIQTGRALLAHEVGMGKTLTMLAAAFKLKDLGIANRPCIAVPSALVEQFGRDALKFFPTRKVLVAEKSDFTAQNRRRFYMRIMNSSFDVIIMSHEQLQRISLSPEFLDACIRKKLAAFRDSLEDAKSSDASRMTIKNIESRVEKYERKLEQIEKNAKKFDDNFLFFEDLGIDFLFVDEAHYFKNYVPVTMHDNIRGMLTNKPSARAEDMLFKCEYLHSLYGDTHVVFATGTPVSNTVGEMWVMENYIQPDVLKAYGTGTFDEWVRAFGNIKTSLELNTTGNKYQAVNRLSDFCNLPELVTQYRTSADVRLTSQLDKSLIDIPQSKNIIVQSHMTEAQKEKFAELIERTDKLKSEKVDPSEDNMLKITHEARTATLDLRLLDPFSYEREDSSKLEQCADNLVRVYKRTNDVKGTQIVFSDMGTPKGSGQFSAYQELKEILIEKGIPEDEIAFVHDYDNDKKKPILQKKMNDGKIRILIGSTSKGGTGFNVQKRVKAIHHLDVPWKPSDIIQRNGRGVRNGNMFKEVEIYIYITKGSFDNYLWQIQEQKLKYITEIMTARDVIRAMHDEDEETMTASQFKAIATGNPYMKLRMTLENKVTLLSNQKRSFERTKSKMLMDIENAKATLEKDKTKLSLVEKDLQYCQENEDKVDQFDIEFADGMRFENATDAANHLRELLKSVACSQSDEDQLIASYRGFMIYAKPAVEWDLFLKKYINRADVQLCREGTYQFSAYPIGRSWTGVGVIRRIKNMVSLNHLKSLKDKFSKNIVQNTRIVESKVADTFELQDQLDYNVAKLNTLVDAIGVDSEDNQFDQEKIAHALDAFEADWQLKHPEFKVSKDAIAQAESDEEIQQKYLNAVNNYNDDLFEEKPADVDNETAAEESVEESEEANDNEADESRQSQAEADPHSTEEEHKEKPEAASKRRKDNYTQEEIASIMSKATKIRENEYQLSLF